jgi:hypothetical protein
MNWTALIFLTILGAFFSGNILEWLIKHSRVILKVIFYVVRIIVIFIIILFYGLLVGWHIVNQNPLYLKGHKIYVKLGWIAEPYFQQGKISEFINHFFLPEQLNKYPSVFNTNKNELGLVKMGFFPIRKKEFILLSENKIEDRKGRYRELFKAVNRLKWTLDAHYGYPYKEAGYICFNPNKPEEVIIVDFALFKDLGVFIKGQKDVCIEADEMLGSREYFKDAYEDYEKHAKNLNQDDLQKQGYLLPSITIR